MYDAYRKTTGRGGLGVVFAEGDNLVNGAGVGCQAPAARGGPTRPEG